MANHIPKHPEHGLINLPSSPVKAVVTLNDRLAAEASESTADHDRDSAVGVCGDDTDQSSDESDWSSDLQDSAVDSGSKSSTGDCLMSSDNEEVAVDNVNSEVLEETMSLLCIAKICLWSEAKLKQIGDSLQAVWGSNHEIIQT